MWVYWCVLCMCVVVCVCCSMCVLCVYVCANVCLHVDVLCVCDVWVYVYIDVCVCCVYVYVCVGVLCVCDVWVYVCVLFVCVLYVCVSVYVCRCAMRPWRKCAEGSRKGKGKRLPVRCNFIQLGKAQPPPGTVTPLSSDSTASSFQGMAWQLLRFSLHTHTVRNMLVRWLSPLSSLQKTYTHRPTHTHLHTYT
jgi:hypothetical protein